jgi:spermidine dehydrogenase
MSTEITRRDFIDGFACAVAGAALPRGALGGARGERRGVVREDPPGGALNGVPGGAVDPPALTGLRGSRGADLAVAHALRDGAVYRFEDYPLSAEVDCVIVGAGLSGLSSAYYVQRARPRSSILILDNHDDFGGHARRNEFEVDGRRLIGYGGSEAIQAPKSGWSPAALGLLADLDVRLDVFATAIDTNLYPGLGLSTGLFFAREDFGKDVLVSGDPQRTLPSDIPERLHRGRPIGEFAADCPLTDSQREKLIELYTGRRAVLPGASAKERRAMLERISYADFLRQVWEVDPTLLKIFLGRTRDLFALSSDLVPALSAAACGLPGFQGLELGKDDDAVSNFEPYIYHFPDGNASLARLLVRRLIPRAARGTTMEDIVTAPFDYGALDVAGAPVRLRLSSTVVRMRNRDSGVDVLYVNAGRVSRIRCRHAIYAGMESMLPYLCDGLPPAQRAETAANVRAPLVYVTVALRQWRPWVARGVHNVVNPTGFYSVMKLDYPVSLGGLRFARSPDEPILVHLCHIPRPPTGIGDRRAAVRAARGVLYARPFADFEAALRDEMGRVLGPGGFDADRDIAAITVNRWGHGYAYEPDKLSDPTLGDGYIRAARRPVGRISIAGSDAAWAAYAQAAIDEAHRAAHEVTARA